MTKTTMVLVAGLVLSSGCYIDMATEDSSEGLFYGDAVPSVPPAWDDGTYDYGGYGTINLDVDANLSGTMARFEDFNAPAYRVVVNQWSPDMTELEVHVDPGGWAMVRLVLEDEPGQGALTSGSIVSLGTPDSPVVDMVGCAGPSEFNFDYDGPASEATVEVEPADDPDFVSLTFRARFDDYNGTYYVEGSTDYPVQGIY